jgi:membrane protease YdiL (CAAX protease family)
MAAESKSLIPQGAIDGRLLSAPADGSGRSLAVDLLFQVGLVFALIMIAVWTPQGRANTVVSLSAAFFILWFTLRGRYSIRELGLARPGSGAFVMFVSGAAMVGTIALAGLAIHGFGPPQPVPWRRAWQYAIWALQQEFILQSFFYVRLESLLGSRRALWAAAFLFGVPHLPSPVLTLLSFVGGWLFCELFRRYRNIFPLGVVHAMLGLTIAASLPDSLLHHMRVGLGYIVYHR